jgi:dsRNA-specific ribonuclease
MKPEDHQESQFELAGWPVRMVSYKLGETYVAKIDNVSPGAQIARAEGASREEAESRATEDAQRRLQRTRRMPVD